jgi:signal transduction histidine kinase
MLNVYEIPPAFHRTLRSNRSGARITLIAAFAGLLAIMAAEGLDSLRIAREIQISQTQMRNDFLSRDRMLGEIRSGLYESGNVVRDYILVESDKNAAETLRSELKTIRDGMEVALKTYPVFMRSGETGPFHQLTTEVESYWSILDPIFHWDAKARRNLGNSFLRHEVLPRRTTVLAIAREVSEVNQQAQREEEGRMADLFAQFQRRLRVITALGLGLGLVVAALTVAYTRRLDRTTDERFQESFRHRDELKDLSARLVNAQEGERRAISRELHDEVGQSLSALLMEVEHVAMSPDAGGVLRERLDRMKPLVENCVNVVRNISLLLRPSMLDDLGLVAALEWQAREVAKRSSLAVDVLEHNVSDTLPDEFRTCVYRVVQEALSNCSKHSQAKCVRIMVRQESKRLLLTVQDDGRGFNAHRVRGLGLVGMSERVAHLGGTFAIESQDGRGTLLRIELPLPRHGAAADLQPHEKTSHTAGR